MSLLNVEAILFAYGRWVKEEEVSKIIGKKAKPFLKELQKKYNEMESSLQVSNENDLWKFTVHDDYLNLVKGIVTKTELEPATLETLAVIAFKSPAMQSEIIHLRSTSAYDHIKQLLDAGFVTREKHGRSFKLKLLPKFFDYFDLPKDKAKDFFSEFEEVEKVIKEKQEEIDKALEAEAEQKKIIEQKAKENLKSLTDFN